MTLKNVAPWALAAATLVLGLDGGHYLPYKASTVRAAQMRLGHQGVYTGYANGVLDRETMQATAEFQKQNGLEPSGIPSPRTRDKLGIY